MSDWLALLAAASRPDDPVEFETYQATYGSASKPVRCECSDGHVYVVKGPRDMGSGKRDRTPFNEQVVARLGLRLGAPIPPIALVRLSDVMWNAERNLQHFPPGLLHGSRFQTGCTDRQWGRDAAGVNRSRLAALCVLYSWMNASDHQVIHEVDPPHLVWSVDHGHFFLNDPQWTPERLGGVPAASALDPQFAFAGLTVVELATPFDCLASLTHEEIAAAVARPPEDWGVTMEERVALCDFLERRRQQVLTLRPRP